MIEDDRDCGGGIYLKKNVLTFSKLLSIVYFVINDLGNYNYLRINGFF